jgi:hypothetical protein
VAWEPFQQLVKQVFLVSFQPELQAIQDLTFRPIPLIIVPPSICQIQYDPCGAKRGAKDDLGSARSTPAALSRILRLKQAAFFQETHHLIGSPLGDVQSLGDLRIVYGDFLLAVKTEQVSEKF